MENQKNRIYYNIIDCERKHYLAGNNKLNYARFICRVPDKHIEKFKEIEWNCAYEFVSKANNAEDRDRTKLYDFDIIPYDNSGGREMNTNFVVIISLPEFVNEIKDILIEQFGNLVEFKKCKNTYTTQIDPSPDVRGTWITEKKQNPIKYPICILSYKRANKYGFTSKLLSRLKIPHYLFVEPQEEDIYKEWIGDDLYCSIVIGARNYSIEDKMGSSPMRNFILDCGKENSFDMVWMLDDNIKSYKRYYQGVKNDIESYDIFASVEEYIRRYDNVGIVSHNFNPFIREGDARTCIVKNNKCYSSMLIHTGNDIRFRYKYNEDVLMSIEYICKGFCNLSFNHILYDKDTSGSNKGGNQENIYCDNGYKKKYDYLLYTLHILFIEGKLKLKDDKSVEDFIKLKSMVSKDYHHQIEYSMLDGENNEIVKNNSYVKSKYKSRLKFNKIDKIETK